MTTLREAAQQALEALLAAWQHNPHWQTNDAITALRDALAQQEQDWQDLYRKEKARADMWRDKYESLAGPDERVYPQQEQDTNPHQHAVDDWRLHGGPGETRTTQTPCDIAEDGVCEVIDCCRNRSQILEALEIGYDSAQAEAAQYHVAMAGYRPERHAEMDANVAKIAKAITALRAALAQEQEPAIYPDEAREMGLEEVALYTHPPRREWQGLTDEEAEELEFASVDRKYGHLDVRALSRAIETKLKEKNT